MRRWTEPDYETVTPDGEDVKQGGSCVIKAISFATDIPYWRVWQALQNGVKAKDYRGYKHKNSGYYQGEWEHALTELGVKWVHLPVSLNDSDMTIAQFQREYAKREHRYLFSARRHMMGIKDGLVNHKASRYRRERIYVLDCSDVDYEALVQPEQTYRMAAADAKPEAPEAEAPAEPSTPAEPAEPLTMAQAYVIVQSYMPDACSRFTIAQGRSKNFQGFFTRTPKWGDSVRALWYDKNGEEADTIHITFNPETHA